MFEKQIDDDLKIRLADEDSQTAFENLVLGEVLRSSVDSIRSEQATAITAASISSNAEAIGQGWGFNFDIFYKGERAGFCSFGYLGNQGHWEHRRGIVGYALDLRHRGQGIMTRVLSVVLDIIYSQLGFDRIELTCDLDNTKSKAVAERVGFTLEGRHRHAKWDGDQPVDSCVFSMLAEEWLATSQDG